MIVSFRIGRFLAEGDVVESRGGLHRVSLPEGKHVSVHERFLLKSSADLVEGSKRTLADMIVESVSPFLASGQPFRSGPVRIVGFDRVKSRLLVTENNEFAKKYTGLPFERVLAVEDIGERLALEAHRELLEWIGLVEPRVICMDSYVDLPRPIHVFMKSDPFRDITKLHEGTAVEVVGYYKGAAIVEADGETFWRPLEPFQCLEMSANLKDAEYYFNLDKDKGRIPVPTPLNVLPSKPGIDQAPGDALPEENWNVTPELHHSAGEFAPLPELGDPIPDLLHPSNEMKENYGALFYYHDWQQQWPMEHGLGGAAAFSTPDPQAFIERLEKGEPVSSVFSEEASFESFKPIFEKDFESLFGSQPDESVVRSAYLGRT